MLTASSKRQRSFARGSWMGPAPWMFLVVAFLASPIRLQAQATETIRLTPVTDGFSAGNPWSALFVHTDGSIYATAGPRYRHEIYSITAAGTIELFSQNLEGPMDMAEDADGNVLVALRRGNQVHLVDREGRARTFVEGHPGEIGVIGINNKGDVFVFFDLNEDYAMLLKFSGEGELLRAYYNTSLKGIVGIAFDEQDNIYLADGYDGEILRLDEDTGEFDVVGTAPAPTGRYSLGRLVFMNGYLYAGDLSHDVVYQITLDGSFTILASTSSEPYAIAASPSEDALYVAQGGWDSVPHSLLKITISNR